MLDFERNYGLAQHRFIIIFGKRQENLGIWLKKDIIAKSALRSLGKNITENNKC
jgi:hypothetical protein